MFRNNMIGVPTFRRSLEEGSPFTSREYKTSTGRRSPSSSSGKSTLSSERYSVVSLGRRSIKMWLISLTEEFCVARIERLRKKLGSVPDSASDACGYTLSIKSRKCLECVKNGGNSIVPFYLGSKGSRTFY